MQFKFIREYEIEKLQWAKKDGEFTDEEIEYYAKQAHYGPLNFLLILEKQRPFIFLLVQAFLSALTSLITMYVLHLKGLI